MFYRLLGRFFFYCFIVPVIGRMGRFVVAWTIKMTAKNINDSSWTVKKELADIIADRIEKVLYGDTLRNLSKLDPTDRFNISRTTK